MNQKQQTRTHQSDIAALHEALDSVIGVEHDDKVGNLRTHFEATANAAKPAGRWRCPSCKFLETQG